MVDSIGNLIVPEKCWPWARPNIGLKINLISTLSVRNLIGRNVENLTLVRIGLLLGGQGTLDG